MKEIKINEFQNFNQVIEVYQKSLNVFASNQNNQFDKKKIDELTDPKYGISFAIITAINFSQILEYLDENNILDKNKWHENYYTKSLPPKAPLSNIFASLDDINVKDIPNSDKSLESFLNKIHKIRNCLAHGRYHLILSDNGSNTDLNHCYLEFDDPDYVIEGRIIFSDMRDFGKQIKDYFIDSKNKEYSMEYTSFKSSNLNIALSEYIKKIYKKNNNNNKKCYLSKEEISKLKQYFSLVGKKGGIDALQEYMKSQKSILKKSLKRDFSIENITQNSFKDRFFYRFSKLLNLIIEGGHSQFDDNFNTFLATIYMGYGKDSEDKLSDVLTFDDEKFNDINRQVISLFEKLLSNVTKEDIRNEDRKILYLKKPILYTDTLMSMCNYMIGYIRECNINYGRNIFKFSDIDIGDIKIINEDSEEPSIREINLGERVLIKTREKEEEKSKKKENITQILSKFTKQKKGELQNLLNYSSKLGIDEEEEFYSKLVELGEFESNLKISDLDNLNYEEIKRNLEEFKRYFEKNTNELNQYPELMRINLFKNLTDLRQYFLGVSEINTEIESLEEEYEEVKDEDTYIDYSGLFGHIRNSIVHTNFNVNYSLAARTRNYEDIEFDFEDFKKGDPNWLTFKCTMKAKDLMHLLNSLQESITNQVNNSDKNKKFEILILHKALIDLGISSDELNEHNIDNLRQKLNTNNKEDTTNGQK